MKYSDARYGKTSTLICGNTQLWSLWRWSTNTDACARLGYADTCIPPPPPPPHFATVLIYDSTVASRVYTAKWLEWKWMTGRCREEALWLLIPAGRWRRVEKYGRDFPPRLDEQIVNNSTHAIPNACCDPWFLSLLLTSAKKAWQENQSKGATSQKTLFEHFKIRLQFHSESF